MESIFPLEVIELTSANQNGDDDLFIAGIGWEQRCLGSFEKMKKYRCNVAVLCVYDQDNPLVRANLASCKSSLSCNRIVELSVNRENPLATLRSVISTAKEFMSPTITFDVTSFARKHLLQILQGLDLNGLLSDAQLIHSTPQEFSESDGSLAVRAYSSVRALETFVGLLDPSKDTVLVIFLGYESQRAQALWTHVEPNISYAVIPHPPYNPVWQGRTEALNKFLLSSIPEDHIKTSGSLNPQSSLLLLESILQHGVHGGKRYNYIVAPMGTKAQTVGIYRYWRRYPETFTILYSPSIGRFGDSVSSPLERTWIIDKTSTW